MKVRFSVYLGRHDNDIKEKIRQIPQNDLSHVVRSILRDHWFGKQVKERVCQSEGHPEEKHENVYSNTLLKSCTDEAVTSIDEEVDDLLRKFS